MTSKPRSSAREIARSVVQSIRGPADRRRYMRRLAAMLRPYRWRIAGALTAIVVATAAGLAPPFLVAVAIDRGIGDRDYGALVAVVAAFAVAAVAYMIATRVQTYLVGWVGQRVLTELRLSIFAHLQRMSLGYFAKKRSGVLISRMTNDVEALDELVNNGLVALLYNALNLVGVVVILLLLDWRLALLTFATFPVLAIGSIVFRAISASAYGLVRERIAVVTGYLQETLSGIRVVRAFAQEPRHRSAFADLNEEYRQANMRTVYLNASYYPSVELLSAVGTAVILLVGGYQAISGRIEIGIVVAFVGYLASFFDPIQQLSNLYTTYQQGMAAMDKIFALLEDEPDLVDRPGAADPGRIAGTIRFEGVGMSYDAGETWALRGVDLEIPAGQTVALVGHTGAGKSTLAKLVPRFYDATEGRVTIDGHDLRDLQATPVRSQMGIVPQEGFLFSGTIRDNLAFSRDDADEAALLAAAGAVGARELIDGLPEGLDTEIGERGVRLSAGQRQLMALARALVADPRVVILDEATSSVDVRTEERLERGVSRLLSGRTAIVIAHRLSTIRTADRIVVLDRGRIVESGTHDELTAKGGTYARLYGEWRSAAT